MLRRDLSSLPMTYPAAQPAASTWRRLPLLVSHPSHRISTSPASVQVPLTSPIHSTICCRPPGSQSIPGQQSTSRAATQSQDTSGQKLSPVLAPTTSRRTTLEGLGLQLLSKGSSTWAASTASLRWLGDQTSKALALASTLVGPWPHPSSHSQRRLFRARTTSRPKSGWSRRQRRTAIPTASLSVASQSPKSRYLRASATHSPRVQ